MNDFKLYQSFYVEGCNYEFTSTESSDLTLTRSNEADPEMLEIEKDIEIFLELKEKKSDILNIIDEKEKLYKLYSSKKTYDFVQKSKVEEEIKILQNELNKINKDLILVGYLEKDFLEVISKQLR